jgi:hypothetical protein
MSGHDLNNCYFSVSPIRNNGRFAAAAAAADWQNKQMSKGTNETLKLIAD